MAACTASRCTYSSNENSTREYKREPCELLTASSIFSIGPSSFKNKRTWLWLVFFNNLLKNLPIQYLQGLQLIRFPPKKTDSNRCSVIMMTGAKYLIRLTKKLNFFKFKFILNSLIKVKLICDNNIQ